MEAVNTSRSFTIDSLFKEVEDKLKKKILGADLAVHGIENNNSHHHIRSHYGAITLLLY
jgi:hypothetical protein